MSAVGRARAWLRAALLRSRMEREMHEEMAAHLAQAAERFISRGMSEREARAAARREFGHVSTVQQHGREARGGQWADALASDLKYAFRYYARTPLTTITIVLTLALGIGFSSAVFSVVTGIVRRPAPGVPDDPSLVKVRGISNQPPFARLLTYAELTAYAELTDKFDAVAGWTDASVVVDPGETSAGVVSARAQFVTPNYFAALGVKLGAGRGFSQSRFEDLFPAELTAIVSDAFATTRLGGVRAAVGKQVKVNDVVVTIVGVGAPDFNGAVQSGWDRTLWLPLSSWQTVTKSNQSAFTNPNAHLFESFARLRSGVSMADAIPAVKAVAARADAVAKARASRTWTATADLVRLRGMMDLSGRFPGMGAGVTFSSAAALLILLVCTTTVNSLLVGAAVGRRYETGVRLALGASRPRVVRQFLTEIALLAIAGGALGMWVFGTLAKVTEVAQDGFDVAPDWRTTGFTMLYALVAATLSGLTPALHATRTGLADLLKDSPTGATRRSRYQRRFVVAQIAIGQPLMVSLAAVVVSLAREVAPDDYAPLREQVIAASFSTYASINAGAPDKIPALMERFAALPGVSAVVPMGLYGPGHTSLQLLAPPGRVAPNTLDVSTFVFGVGPGYFHALSVPMVRGRDFVASDTAPGVVPVVINETVAGQLFASNDPIGQRLNGVSRYDGTITPMEVVGVVRLNAELFHRVIDDVPPVFAPLRRGREGLMMIRTAGRAESLIPTLVAVAREEAPTLPLERIETLAEARRHQRSVTVKVVSALLGGSAFALILSGLGLYAMVSIAVARRRREIGIRMALGAHAREVVRMFFSGGLRTALLGLTIGMLPSIAGVLVLPTLLHRPWAPIGVAPVLVSPALAVVASLASWLPARRAANVDPMIALRTE